MSGVGSADGEEAGSSTHIFYIAVGIACALIVLVAIIVAFFYLNSQKSTNRAYAERIRYEFQWLCLPAGYIVKLLLIAISVF